MASTRLLMASTLFRRLSGLARGRLGGRGREGGGELANNCGVDREKEVVSPLGTKGVGPRKLSSLMGRSGSGRDNGLVWACKVGGHVSAGEGDGSPYKILGCECSIGSDVVLVGLDTGLDTRFS